MKCLDFNMHYLFNPYNGSGRYCYPYSREEMSLRDVTWLAKAHAKQTRRPFWQQRPCSSNVPSCQVSKGTSTLTAWTVWWSYSAKTTLKIFRRKKYVQIWVGFPMSFEIGENVFPSTKQTLNLFHELMD